MTEEEKKEMIEEEKEEMVEELKKFEGGCTTTEDYVSTYYYGYDEETEEVYTQFEFFFSEGTEKRWKVDFDNFKESLLEIARQIERSVDFPPFEEFKDEFMDSFYIQDEELEERASELYSLSYDVLERSFSRIASELREIAEKF